MSPASKRSSEGEWQPRPLGRNLSLTVTAMFIVLTLIFTLIGVNVTGLPGGYVHLGNIPVLVAALFFGKRIAAISGGVGMALFDLMGGYLPWAPFTLVIGFLMGLTLALILKRRSTLPFFLLAVVLAAAIKVVGYYFAEVLLYGNWIVPLTSIPANIAQVLIAAIVVLLIRKPLKAAVNKIIYHRR